MVRALPPLPRRAPPAQRRADWASLGCSVSRFVGAGPGEAAGDGQPPLAELTGDRVRRTFDDVEVADISLEDYSAVKVRATARRKKGILPTGADPGVFGPFLAAQVCHLPAAHRWPVPDPAIPQGHGAF